MKDKELNQLCADIITKMYEEAGANDISRYTLTTSGWHKDGFVYCYEVTFKRNGDVKDVVYANTLTKKEFPHIGNALKKRLNEMLEELYRKGECMPSLEVNDCPLDVGFRDNQDLIDYLYG